MGHILAYVLIPLIGALFILYAYREPPRAIEHVFRIPVLFIFLPAHSRVKLGRITIGLLLILTSVGALLRDVYHWLMG